VGLLLSLDGIRPDKGNETIYLVRSSMCCAAAVPGTSCRASFRR